MYGMTESTFTPEAVKPARHIAQPIGAFLAAYALSTLETIKAGVFSNSVSDWWAGFLFTLLVPTVLVALVSIFPSGRSRRTRRNIFFYWSLFILATSIPFLFK
jgi:hypothetical protein